jgi:hypothetical protein
MRYIKCSTIKWEIKLNFYRILSNHLMVFEEKLTVHREVFNDLRLFLQSFIDYCNGSQNAKRTYWGRRKANIYIVYYTIIYFIFSSAVIRFYEKNFKKNVVLFIRGRCDYIFFLFWRCVNNKSLGTTGILNHAVRSIPERLISSATFWTWLNINEVW